MKSRPLHLVFNSGMARGYGFDKLITRYIMLFAYKIHNLASSSRAAESFKDIDYWDDVAEMLRESFR